MFVIWWDEFSFSIISQPTEHRWIYHLDDFRISVYFFLFFSLPEKSRVWMCISWVQAQFCAWRGLCFSLQLARVARADTRQQKKRITHHHRQLDACGTFASNIMMVPILIGLYISYGYNHAYLKNICFQIIYVHKSILIGLTERNQHHHEDDALTVRINT